MRFWVGPKLYEANWLQLQNDGYIAAVKCYEIWCPMTELYYREYLNEDYHTGIQRVCIDVIMFKSIVHASQCLCVMNPNKIHACEFLLRMHAKRGDKTIVFSDDIFALRTLATKLKMFALMTYLISSLMLSLLSHYLRLTQVVY